MAALGTFVLWSFFGLGVFHAVKDVAEIAFAAHSAWRSKRRAR